MLRKRELDLGHSFCTEMWAKCSIGVMKLGFLFHKKKVGVGGRGCVPSHFIRRKINFSCNPDSMIFRTKLILTIASFAYIKFFMRKQ